MSTFEAEHSSLAGRFEAEHSFLAGRVYLPKRESTGIFELVGYFCSQYE